MPREKAFCSANMENDALPPKPSIDPTLTYTSSTSNAGSSATWIAIIIGLVAVAFGVIGIFFGLSAQSKVSEVQSSVNDMKNDLPNQIESGMAGLDNVSQDIVSIKQAVEALKSRSRMDRDSQNRKLDTLAKELEANRQQINQNIGAIEELPKRLISAPRQNATASQSSGDSAEVIEPTVTASGETLHTIASGDLLGRLATRYGVSVQAILDANPGLDPRRLRVGQQIVIPSQ